MKKILIVLSISMLLVSCGKKAQRDDAEDSRAVKKVLETWQHAIQKQSYKTYAQTEVFPDEKEIFNKEFSSIYYEKIMILSESPTEKKMLNGGEFYVKNITVAAEIIDRSDRSPKGMVNGTMVMVRSAGADSSWKIHNTTLVRSL